MACAFAVTLLFSLGNTTQGTLLADFADHYGIGALPQSFISAAASLGMAASLCVLLTGLVRVTKNALYVAAVGVMSLSLGSLERCPVFRCSCHLYALLGMSFGFIDAIGSSLIADVSASDAVARNMGMLHAFYGIGGILGPPLIRAAASFAERSGKIGGASTAALLLAGIAAALFVVNIFGYRAVKRNLPGTLKYPPNGQKAAGLSAFLRSGAVPLLLVCGLNGAYFNVITFRTAQYIGASFGSHVLGAVALSAFWAGTVISRFTVPSLKINLRTYLVAGHCAAALFTALGVFANSAYATVAAVFLCRHRNRSRHPALHQRAVHDSPRKHAACVCLGAAFAVCGRAGGCACRRCADPRRPAPVSDFISPLCTLRSVPSPQLSHKSEK